MRSRLVSVVGGGVAGAVFEWVRGHQLLTGVSIGVVVGLVGKLPFGEEPATRAPLSWRGIRESLRLSKLDRLVSRMLPFALAIGAVWGLVLGLFFNVDTGPQPMIGLFAGLAFSLEARSVWSPGKSPTILSPGALAPSSPGHEPLGWPPGWSPAWSLA
jgi:hypothetical protein